MTRVRRILHPSDFSRASAAAFTKAVETAKDSDAELLIVHVLSTATVPVAPEGYISPKAYQELYESGRNWAQKQVDALLGKADRAGVRATALLLEGVPHDQIVRAARSRRADLIVIGTHGRTGLAKFFLGSVAARVVAMAPCPVLTVRGR